MSLHRLKELFDKRKNDTAVLLGSGSSINNITPQEWVSIQQCDIWTLNNWVYHPFVVPDFYLVETKHYGYDILKRRFIEKCTAYEHCHFLFAYGKVIHFPDNRTAFLRDVVPDDFKRYEYSQVARDQRRRSKLINADYDPRPTCLTKSYDATLTLLLELLWKMNYRKLILYGVDLHNSLYFWSSGDLIYGEVHHLTNKAHEGKDPQAPHNTIIVKDFIVDFARHWMWRQNRAMYVGHKDTALHPEIPYIDVRMVGSNESVD